MLSIDKPKQRGFIKWNKLTYIQISDVTIQIK